jgi:hypothetical protein
MKKVILLDRKAKMAIVGHPVDRNIPGATITFDVNYIKKNYHKEGSYTLMGSKGENRGAVYGVDEIWEHW